MALLIFLDTGLNDMSRVCRLQTCGGEEQEFELSKYTNLTHMYNLCICIYMLMRDAKEERSKQGHTNNKAKIDTPKAVTVPKNNVLPRVGFEPTTLRTLDRTVYQLSY